MDPYKETFNTWNKVASLYEEKFMDLAIYNATYDLICKAVKVPNAKLLEIGCGPGNITKYLLTKRPDFDVLGIDVAPTMINLAKKNVPSAHFKVMDAREIITLNNTFDAIICGFCLPYLALADGKKLIIDLHQLLNKNGLIYISFVEGDYEKSGLKVGSSGDGTYFYFYDLDTLKKLLSEAGFHQFTTLKVPFAKSDNQEERHTILIANKK